MKHFVVRNYVKLKKKNNVYYTNIKLSLINVQLSLIKRVILFCDEGRFNFYTYSSLKQ